MQFIHLFQYLKILGNDLFISIYLLNEYLKAVIQIKFKKTDKTELLQLIKPKIKPYSAVFCRIRNI